MEVKVEIGRKEAQLVWLKEELRGLDEQITEAQARRDDVQAQAGRMQESQLLPLLSSAASSVAERSVPSSSLAATEREQALQEDLLKTRTDLDETRRAYKGEQRQPQPHLLSRAVRGEY